MLSYTLLTALATLPMASLVGATDAWMLNGVAPLTNIVSVREDLDFRLMSRQEIKKDDCIRYVFNNPYFDDAPETYKSFDMSTPYSQPCKFSTSHEGICSTIDASTFEIKFTEDNPNKKITGVTTGEPFQNPYSSRMFSRVDTVMYEGCDLNKVKVEGRTSVSAFQQQVILQNEINLTSSSQKMAVPNAVLTVSFTVKSQMPNEGSVSLKVPPWYTISAQRLPVQYSSDSMLGFDSTASFTSHASKGFTVMRQNFDASNRALLIVYQGTSTIEKGEKVVFKITDFKNPVNQSPKFGFLLTTMDAQGYLVDQSEGNLKLNTGMTEVGSLVGKEVMMLGDPNGLNIGRVFEYNKMSFFMSSYIPLEQFCYFKFVFPQKLKIDEELTMIEGDGIFRPFDGSKFMPNHYWSADLDTNTLYVEGCKLPQFLNSRPFGVITFSYVLLPDYVTDTDPVEVYAYSDNAYLQVVFEESKTNGGGLTITREMLQPGHLELLQFRPSNFFAFVKDVRYTISIAPGHDMLPSTRIVITMPKAIVFDPNRGCSIAYTEGNCQIAPENNEIILTDVFKERTPGGTVLKFVVFYGDNPIGAQYAGDWSARTEGVHYGEYFIVDGNTGAYSFEALPGHILSTLTYRGTKTFSDSSFYDFTFDTEHSIPKDGYLRVNLPVEMAFPPETVESKKPIFQISSNILSSSSNRDSIIFTDVTPEYIQFQFPKSHNHKTQNPLRLTLEGVRTPRSFRPSSEFSIQTRTPEGYVIDAGGSDITVTMNQMSELKAFDIHVDDLSNGAVTAYKFKIDTFLYLKDQDRILITTPPTVGFGQEGLSCEPVQPDPVGVSQVSCENIDEKTLAVTFTRVDKQDGIFEFLVDGIKNPPNFRRSGLFSNIFMQTQDYFNMQKLINYDHLFIETNTPGTIKDYRLHQSTELYGFDAVYTISFFPFNEISKDGIITLEWTDQVLFYDDDPVCKVETFQAFTDAPHCIIDFANRIITIEGVFKEEKHSSEIQITLDMLRNPMSNIGLKKFKLRTYDDPDKIYPIDMLDYNPLTSCNWPCERCSSDKDFCYKCWDRPDVSEKYLTTSELYSTCADSCHPGFTTDGNKKLICSACDTPCGTCAETGVKGDKYKCLTCADGYPYRLKDSCVPSCPAGTFLQGEECLECSSKCGTCVDTPENCLSCVQESDHSFLLGNKCIDKCPSKMGSLAGVCFDCIFPCHECSTGPEICTTCSQERGIAFLLGPTCTNQCPVGYIVNEEERICEGCGPGCIDCDPDDQRICLQCAKGLMSMDNDCVTDCPSGYLSNYSANECRRISDLDIHLIPFPCIIIAVVFFFLSYVGSKQKPKHLLIPNWLVLMGYLEQGILLSQIILTGKYGTSGFMAFIMIAWLIYNGTNVAFIFLFIKRIVRKDKKFRNWRNKYGLQWAKWLILVGGLIGSWKTHKLCYSAFWGFKMEQAKFNEPGNFRALQKLFLQINIYGCYAIVILLNLIGLFTIGWGTQLYIQILENIIIFATLIWAGTWEQKKQESEFLADNKFKPRLDMMAEIEESERDQFTKTKEELLQLNEVNKLFVERKFQDLITMFGGRQCKSAFEPRDLQEDYRRCKTWPVSPDYIPDDAPLEPLPDPYPDNCYSRGLTEEQMLQMLYLSKGMQTKALQSDAYDADQNLRKDAFLIGHQRDLAEQPISLRDSQDRKRTRGRKNRYFRQIDNEDHDAGFLMDDDAQGKKENVKARNELLDAATSLEVKRQAEEKKVEMQETKLRAIELTEENLRLKKVLEEQRMVDAQDQKDIQKRILEEESRRQQILATIEQARKDRENRKNALMDNLNAEKDVRMKEIDKMKNEQLAKMQNLPEKERLEAEATFNAEKARLESEFNEKMLKSQREAAPSETANSPGRHSKTEIAAKQEAVRIRPTGTAPAHATNEKILSDDRQMQNLPTDQNVTDFISSPPATGKSGKRTTGKGGDQRYTSKGGDSAKGSFAKGGDSVQRSSVKGGDSIHRSSSRGGDSVQRSSVKGGDSVQRSLAKRGDSVQRSSVKGGDSVQRSPSRGTKGDSVHGSPSRGGADDAYRSSIKEGDSVHRLSVQRGETGTSIKQSLQNTPQKSIEGKSSAQQSPLASGGGKFNISGMMTADDASGLGESFMMNMEFEKRDFNEIDILGTLDRDDKGNIIVPVDERTGSKKAYDKEGRPINQYGYLIDSNTGNVVQTDTGAVVFSASDLDERGNIPMPFALEKFNFNPFDLLGTFFYDDVEDPLSFQKSNHGNRFVDELGRKVSLQGFLVDEQGSIVNKAMIKRFDWKQFRQFGGLMPKLYNYYGKTFELQEVMGVFDRDSRGNIQLLLGKDEKGKDVYVDKAGFMVNQRGYIVTRDGHVCTREGKVLFLKAHLKNGEFPKIFPFTRFNINRIVGDVEMDPGGQPILLKNANDQSIDQKGRLVNDKGFLCDSQGNVVDIRGKIVFEKALLEHSGDIPEIFRSNILRSDSQSSLSRFMSEIDRDQRFDDSGIGKHPQLVPRHAGASDTSFESMMEDSPSKYDKQNMRFSHSNPDSLPYGSMHQPKSARWAGTIPDNIMEEMSEYEAGAEPHRRKRKRNKGKGYIVEAITGRDVQMANAYGGVAKPRIRKTGPRFSSVARIDRTGLQTSQGSIRPSKPRIQNFATKPFIEQAEPSLQQRLETSQQQKAKDVTGNTTRGELTTQRTGVTFDAGKHSLARDPNTMSGWHDQHAEHPSIQESCDESAGLVNNLRNKRSVALKKRQKGGPKPKVETSKITTTPNQMQMPKYEEEFEKVYKKDIDQFIEGSDFDVESLAGFSEISKGTFKSVMQDPRMKGLEKVYLQRLEFQQLGQKVKQKRSKPIVKREFLDRFCDDPKYIAKGEQLKFEMGAQTQTGSSGKKKSPAKEQSYMEAQQQRSHSSLFGNDAEQKTGQNIRPTQTPQTFNISLQESGHSGKHDSQQQPPSRQNLR